MIRITIEEYTQSGWEVKQKTTDLDDMKKYLSLSGLAKLLGLTRGQFRYKYKK